MYPHEITDRKTRPFYTLRGSNRFCGPGAISLLTSVSTTTVESLIGGKVAGTDGPTLVSVLTLLGYEAHYKELMVPLMWYKFHKEYATKHRRIVGLTDHWVAVWGNQWACSRNPHGGILNQYANPRKRVDSYIDIS